MVKAEVDTSALNRALARLRKELSEDSLKPTLIDAGTGIEKRAKTVHTHKAKSHNLENSPFSTVDDDGLTVTLDPENNLPYAEYIHEDWGDPFLYRAFENQKSDIYKSIVAWVKKGIKRAGF